MNPTSSGSHFEPPFFNYIKPYMIYFNDRDNPKEKKKNSLEIVNQRRSFSQNILKSIFSVWGLF